MAENKKPLYQPWNEEEFQADVFVRGMNAVQRWMYRSLLQASFFHTTRPYLPNDDRILWVLAGCENRAQWLENKAEVLERFTPVPDVDGMLENKRVTSDWRRLSEFREEQAEKGARRAANSERGADGTFKPKTGMPVLMVANQPPATAGNRVEEHPAAIQQEKLKGSEGKDKEKVSERDNTTGGAVLDSSTQGKNKNLGCDWGNLRSKHRRIFNKKPDKGFFFNKYHTACGEYGEEIVLACFDEWAPTALGWVKRDDVDHPLHAFFKKLPDLAEEERITRDEVRDEETALAAEESKRKETAAAVEASVLQQMTEHAKFMEYKHPLRDAGEDPEEAMRG